MTVRDVEFRQVESDDDLVMLDRALRRLSYDLGDVHAADMATMKQALMGLSPSAHALLAVAEGGLAGAALYSPLFSTVKGAPGVYVSDLWVADEMRGSGIGKGVLLQVAGRAERLWAATWMTLSVYEHSAESRRFYETLGFVPQTASTAMRLDLTGLKRSMRSTS